MKAGYDERRILHKSLFDFAEDDNDGRKQTAERIKYLTTLLKSQQKKYREVERSGILPQSQKAPEIDLDLSEADIILKLSNSINPKKSRLKKAISLNPSNQEKQTELLQLLLLEKSLKTKLNIIRHGKTH